MAEANHKRQEGEGQRTMPEFLPLKSNSVLRVSVLLGLPSHSREPIEISAILQYDFRWKKGEGDRCLKMRCEPLSLRRLNAPNAGRPSWSGLMPGRDSGVTVASVARCWKSGKKLSFEPFAPALRTSKKSTSASAGLKRSRMVYRRFSGWETGRLRCSKPTDDILHSKTFVRIMESN